MNFKARKSDWQIIDQVTSFPFAAICRREKTNAFNVFGLCKVSCFGHLDQVVGIHLPKSALFKWEEKSGPEWLANQWIRKTVFRPQAKPLWTFGDTITSTLRGHSIWLLGNNKTAKSYVVTLVGLAGSESLGWSSNFGPTADRHSPFQSQDTLNLSAPTAGSNDLILSDRIKAHSGLCSAKDADRSMGARESGNAERKSWSNLDQVITTPSRQNALCRQSWLRKVTRNQAFVISSAAINGLLFVTPLASLAQTTTIYGTGGASNAYSGGTINFADTVILNDGASVTGDIIDNGTL